jgi:hypothetical protein
MLSAFAQEKLSSFRDKESKLYGFKNEKSEVVIKPEYQDIRSFSEGFAAVKKDGKWGYINTKGEVIINFSAVIGHLPRPFSEGLVAREVGRDKWQYYGTDGKPAIDREFTEAGDFKGGQAVVKGIYSYDSYIIDKTGKKVSNYYWDIAPLSDGMYSFYKNKKYGYLDHTGKEVIPASYLLATPFAEGFAVVKVMVKDQEKYGVIDKKGKFVIKPTYDYHVYTGKNPPIVNGVIRFNNGKKKILVNTKGKEIFTLEAGYMGEITKDGFVIIGVNGYGFIDLNGKEIVPPKYQNVENFSNGMAAVMKGNKWGFINTEGKEVIPCQYKKVELPFTEGGTAYVIKFPKQGDIKEELLEGVGAIIDKTGKEVVR